MRTPISVGDAIGMDLGYALLVGDPDDVLVDALGEAIPVIRCPARAVSCPAVHGDACGVRERARVSVVFVRSGGGESEQRLLSCVGVSETPLVVVIAGSDLPPKVFGRFGVVGAGSGHLGVLAAISGVVEGDQVRA